MTTYKLIANPARAGGKSKAIVLEIVELFKRRGCPSTWSLPKGRERRRRSPAGALHDFDVIVAIGGDGTVNEIIPGMLFSNKPLGIIPGGSGNDFIKSLNIPNNIGAAIEVILKGKASVIDVGKINDTYFANGVGIGFDAAVNRASYEINHSKRGLLLYLCALCKDPGKV